jgi:hypothetical protein
MKRLVLTAAIAAAAAANAGEFPPMDVMGPYDTPAAAADRITIPEPATEAGQQHSEIAIERVNPTGVADTVLGNLPGAGSAPPVEVGDVGDVGGRDPPGDDERDDDDDGGKPEKPDKPDKPDKPEKPEDPGHEDDDG